MYIYVYVIDTYMYICVSVVGGGNGGIFIRNWLRQLWKLRCPKIFILSNLDTQVAYASFHSKSEDVGIRGWVMLIIVPNSYFHTQEMWMFQSKFVVWKRSLSCPNLRLNLFCLSLFVLFKGSVEGMRTNRLGEAVNAF